MLSGSISRESMADRMMSRTFIHQAANYTLYSGVNMSVGKTFTGVSQETSSGLTPLLQKYGGY